MIICVIRIRNWDLRLMLCSGHIFSLGQSKQCSGFPSAYKDIYVGCGKSIGFSIYTQLCGFGNVDVYADFKFKKPMIVLLFPCEEEDLKTRFDSLVRDLQAMSSYNKWDVLARSDEAR